MMWTTFLKVLGRKSDESAIVSSVIGAVKLLTILALEMF